MSRLANVPIEVPGSLKVTVEKVVDTHKLSISNDKVTEVWTLHKAVNIEVTDSKILFSMTEADRADSFSRAMLGTDYRHISNLITGMQEPFKTVLEIHGLGYKVKLAGGQLILSMGKSHDDIVNIPENVQVEVPAEKEIVCTSHSKKILGDFVAEVCSKRKPDAYKAKGVRIQGKHYRTKD